MSQASIVPLKMAASNTKYGPLISGPPDAFTIADSTKLEDWKKWQRSFRIYANSINLDVQSHDVQLSTFKSLIGPDALEIYNTFSILDITDVESVMQKFDEHFKPKVNKTAERYKLYKMNQSSEQKFDDFLSDITNQVNKCDFRSLRDEIVLYKIVGGVADEEVRKVLLADEDLKYEKAVEICRASMDMHFMTGDENVDPRTAKKDKDIVKTRSKKIFSGKVKNELSAAVELEDGSHNDDVGSDDVHSDWQADQYSDEKNVGSDNSNKGNAGPGKKKRRHRRYKPEKVTCEICNKIISSKLELKRHMLTHGASVKVTCYHCGGKFSQKRYLVRHMARAHPDVTGKTVKFYQCDECDYKSFYGPNMARHKYQHADVRPHSCELCGYQCIVPRLMKAHMAKHTGEKPYVCQVCLKGFLVSNALKKHMVSHMPPEEREKYYEQEKESRRTAEPKCDTCGKVFSTRGALKTHMVIHTGEKPFACKICDYKAGQKSALITHMVKHSEEKPFVCTVCGYSCKLKRILQAHMLTHTGDRPYACTLCANKFKQLAHLTRHMRIHTGEKPFVCDICGHRWTTQSNLQQHLKVHQNQSGDPSQYTPPRKRRKKPKVVQVVDAPEPTPPEPPVEPIAHEPANAIPQWSEQVSTINPMECFPNLETPLPFHQSYPVHQGNPRPPDCRYFQ